MDGLYKRKAYDLKLFCKDFDEIQQARARGDRSVIGYPVTFYEMKKEQYDRKWGKLGRCFTGQEQRAPDPDDIETMLAMRKAELDAAARENGGAVFNEDGNLAQEPPQNRLYETMHRQPAWDPEAVSNSLCEQFRVKFRRDLTQAELDCIMPAAKMAGADTASEIISHAISQSMGKDAEQFINALLNDLYKGARKAEGIRA